MLLSLLASRFKKTPIKAAGLVIGLAVFLPLAAGCNRSSTTVSDNSQSAQANAPSSGTVSVLGNISGEQQAQLEAALAPFEEETGIEVIYEGTDAFTTLLPVRIDSNDAPDIAMFPQPGLMRSLAQEGALIPLENVLTREALARYYPESWIELSEVDGDVYGIWYRASVKSLVWYVPEEFAAGGYEPPDTWEEMMALSDRMVDDGKTPWCLGLESGSSSGWVGTDWIEEIILRQSGPDYYDRWVNHEVPFNDAKVQEGFETFGEIVRSPGYVFGGQTGALSIPFGESITDLFGTNPDCLMHRQANFASEFFPAEVELGQDIDFFPVPDIDPQYSNALLVAGDIFSMLNDTPEARQLMAYLATPEPHEIWAANGGFLSANKQVDLEVYPDEITRKQAALLTQADIVRFDGSDLMPGSVGTGTFWSGIMDFVAGSSAEQVTDKVEFYWPEDLTANSAQ